MYICLATTQERDSVTPFTVAECSQDLKDETAHPVSGERPTQSEKTKQNKTKKHMLLYAVSLKIIIINGTKNHQWHNYYTVLVM